MFDTFGKFPATAPSVYILMYLQAQHIDTEYYDRHFTPGAYLFDTCQSSRGLARKKIRRHKPAASSGASTKSSNIEGCRCRSECQGSARCLPFAVWAAQGWERQPHGLFSPAKWLQRSRAGCATPQGRRDWEGRLCASSYSPRGRSS